MVICLSLRLGQWKRLLCGDGGGGRALFLFQNWGGGINFFLPVKCNMGGRLEAMRNRGKEVL